MPQVSKVQRLNEDDKSWLDQELVKRGFSGYQELEELCQNRGIDISSSALHRYGSSFRERLDQVKLITEQARAVVAEAPDDEGAVNEALMRLVQERLFAVIRDAQIPTEGIDLPKLAKAIADLGRASVSQKRLAAEARKELLEEQRKKLDALDSKGGVTAETKQAIRDALGIS
ncbi:DUF3486 family protein [Alcanivorax sp.]|uniref:DUF3486 family protein n=1 Tax=Alcanivorax sp. TaxID=1872427 RepID=UPI000C0D239B|nr:DUF3486 family protein [Alcanivorax sp.]PHR68491.1 MAG: terminase [Alcanivorax sp.]